MKESKPVSFPYEKEKLVSQGRPTSLDVIVYSCEGRENEEAPKYRNSGEEFCIRRIQKAFQGNLIATRLYVDFY